MGRTGKLVIVGVVVLLAALGGGYLLFANRTSDSPPPAALDPAPSTTTGGATGTTQAEGDGAATPDGTWQVSGDGASYVGYRVNEQLAFLGSPNQAVGRTTAVTGTMEVTGDTVERVRIEADLTQLTSDEPRRDNAIRQRGLESERFPTATLELAEPIKLTSTPAQGDALIWKAHPERKTFYDSRPGLFTPEIREDAQDLPRGAGDAVPAGERPRETADRRAGGDQRQAHQRPLPVGRELQRGIAALDLLSAGHHQRPACPDAVPDGGGSGQGVRRPGALGAVAGAPQSDQAQHVAVQQ